MLKDLINKPTRYVVTASVVGPKLKTLAEQLKIAGMQISDSNIFEEIGCIAGTAEPNLLETLRQIPEVIDIELEGVCHTWQD